MLTATQILIATVALLQVGDLATTYIALKRGYGTEGNPVVRFFIDRLGLFWGLFVPKAVIFAFCVISFVQMPSFNPGAGTFALWAGLTCLYIYVVLINNMRVIANRGEKRT
ncbi:hypothetical protein HGG70_05140 [Rhodobacteraceae bacterium R_SAG4]|nr:hypothetical protein [Rhodobacteraceae bacterium R_SAG4]